MRIRFRRSSPTPHIAPLPIHLKAESLSFTINTHPQAEEHLYPQCHHSVSASPSSSLDEKVTRGLTATSNSAWSSSDLRQSHLLRSGPRFNLVFVKTQRDMSSTVPTALTVTSKQTLPTSIIVAATCMDILRTDFEKPLFVPSTEYFVCWKSVTYGLCLTTSISSKKVHRDSILSNAVHRRHFSTVDTFRRRHKSGFLKNWPQSSLAIQFDESSTVRLVLESVLRCILASATALSFLIDEPLSHKNHAH